MGSHTPLWFWECSPTLLEVMPLRLCDWAVEIERDEMRKLKQFPAYLNRWDSQQARNEGVFAH
jgi:hypothetical protein